MSELNDLMLQAERLEAAQACRNLMGRYSYLHSAFRNKEFMELSTLAYWICDLVGIESYGCQLIGGLVVFLTRILAVKYHICLPILKGGEEAED